MYSTKLIEVILWLLILLICSNISQSIRQIITISQKKCNSYNFITATKQNTPQNILIFIKLILKIFFAKIKIKILTMKKLCNYLCDTKNITKSHYNFIFFRKKTTPFRCGFYFNFIKGVALFYNNLFIKDSFIWV